MKFLNTLLYLVVTCFSLQADKKHFNKVIIWGHKLHSHTHSYVHYGFYKAFKHLGYDTYWFDNKDDVGTFDFKNSLFITEGQVDEKMPLREDCRYILHYCFQKRDRYIPYIKKGICVELYPYLTKFESQPYWPFFPTITSLQSLEQITPYVRYSIEERLIFMPWATDLLPEEIENNKKQITNPKEKCIYWVGTYIDELNHLTSICKHHNIHFCHVDPWNKAASPEQHIALIQRSWCAPAIQRQWQVDHGYIPCRIFKNISYGTMGITNSRTVYELFEGKVLYNNDISKLINQAIAWASSPNTQQIVELMDLVKKDHTYLNRISNLLEFLNKVKPFNQETVRSE